MRHEFRIRHRPTLHPIGAVLIAVACAHSVGCGSHPDLATVEGVVRLEGAPLTGGRVLLTPYGKGKPAAGPIQPDGSFVLSSYRADDGAKPGKHRVMIVSDTRSQTDQVPADPRDQKQEQPTHLRHRSVWTPPNGFTVEIQADQENHLEIDMSVSTGWKQIMDD